jgi:hypothetical protein
LVRVLAQTGQVPLPREGMLHSARPRFVFGIRFKPRFHVFVVDSLPL